MQMWNEQTSGVVEPQLTSHKVRYSLSDTIRAIVSLEDGQESSSNFRNLLVWDTEGCKESERPNSTTREGVAQTKTILFSLQAFHTLIHDFHRLKRVRWLAWEENGVSLSQENHSEQRR